MRKIKTNVYIENRIDERCTFEIVRNTKNRHSLLLFSSGDDILIMRLLSDSKIE